MNFFPASVPVFSPAAFAAINDVADASEPFVRHMNRGVAFDRERMPDFALAEFEQAAVLRPGDVNAASACASALLQLTRAQAAYERLARHRRQLRSTAEGACNLAVVAGHAGKRDEARLLFAHALALDPDHRRSLSGLSRIAADEQSWEEALRHASHYASLSPAQDLEAHTYLVDILLLARRPADALKAATMAIEALGNHAAPAPLRIRQGVAQACLGSWDAARQSLAGADPADAHALLARLGLPSAPSPREAIDVPAIYVRYAAQNMAEATGLYENALPQMLRALLASPHASFAPRMACRARGRARAALPEAELAAIHAHADAAIAALAPAPPLTFNNRWLGDSRVRIGFLMPRLGDARAARAIAHQFAALDHDRFALHVYAQTPRPLPHVSAPVRDVVHQFVEMAHMPDAEAGARIQLDALDLLVDLSTDSLDARPALIAARVADLQIRLGTDFPHQPATPYDYAVTDAFTHARMTPGTAGNLVRLPYSPWLAAPHSPAPNDARREVRLGVDAPLDFLDRETIASWLQILQQAPAAQLWLTAQPLHVPAPPQAQGFRPADRSGADLLRTDG